jgi:transcription termination/antitermination protein NusG
MTDIENANKEIEVSQVNNQEEDESTKGLDHDNDLADGDSEEFKWYVVQALTGQENKVKKALKERILNFNMTSNFSHILVPEEEVISMAGGKKRRLKKKFFPGYVLIKMVMNDETWHMVKDTDKVSGFIGGSKDKPTPISDEEAAAMTNQVVDGFKAPRKTMKFDEGDSVKVIDGPFASFVGTVEAINEKGKIRVQVSIFGRPTPVELDFTQVEKQ